MHMRIGVSLLLAAGILLADARFEVEGGTPQVTTPYPPYILTPAAPDTPRINGPRVFGVRPGNPFLFTIAATGKRPIQYAVDNLPARLAVDGDTGRITGRLEKTGTCTVTLRAKNALGEARRELRIVVGEKIRLTPPMGWNSWNCWSVAVDAEKVRASARAMADSGLIQHGWTYINIDDCWQGARDAKTKALGANERFPDMKKLCDEIHAMGLRAGIYSTPFISSYAGFPGGSSDHEDGKWVSGVDNQRKNGGHMHGEYSFEEQDAKQWADWGFDYLKYDWHPNDVPRVEAMAKALRKSGRDIVYSLSNNAPFENAEHYAGLANLWRTTGDIRDSWDSLTDIWRKHEQWAAFSGPGHYNDPDMLVIGEVGWDGNPKPSGLTADEQYTHISLWCLWSAPLLIGTPLERLDAFTLNLLTNDEVLEVDQDPLCIQAQPVRTEGEGVAVAKKMEDGSWAAGLFNKGEKPAKVRVQWSDLKVEGKQQVRDLWRQKDLGVFTEGFEAEAPRHGVVLVRIRGAAR
jgi:alpha-galactosidase